MRMRLEPEDDLLHAADDDPNFNESRYYNFADAGAGVGGWVRMGNRPNERYAEMTVCVYLPDGRVGFMFQRPVIEGHHAHDAGGLRFEVLAPYAEHRVTYDATVCVLDRPRDMADPKAAFASNPHEPCTIDLHLTAVGRPFGGEPEYEPGEVPPAERQHGFARGHTEQHMALNGVVQVGEHRYELADGVGFRDHSWGPRIWQSIPWYRWLNASFGPLGIAFTLRGLDERRSHAERVRLRRGPLRRRPLGADPRRGPDVRVRRRRVPAAQPKPSSPPTTPPTTSSARSGPTSRCATAGTAGSPASPRA